MGGRAVTLAGMTESGSRTLRVSSPADLVEVVPYLLGYHPSESLVGLALRGARRRVAFTMRLDLPPDDDEGCEAAACVAAYLAHAQAEQAVLLVYGETGDVLDGLPRRRLVDASTDALAQRRIEVVEALYVAAGRWWSYTCANPVCCPSAGTRVPPSGWSAVAAEATYAGLVAQPNREALERGLEPIGFVAAKGMARALARAEVALAERVAGEPGRAAVRAESLRLLRAAADTEEALSDDAAARLILAIDDVAVRDGCCDWAETGLAEAGLRLWTQLARRAVPPHDAAPLCMVGWFAWHTGKSTLARIAVERCLRSDPAYDFGVLLLAALDGAVNPAALRRRTRRRRRRR